MSGRPSFFVELKRRNVLRAAVVYVGATWALARGIAQLTPVLDLQDWATRAFLIGCAIGLPITRVVAWNFEGILDLIRQLVSVEPSPPSDAASAPPVILPPQSRIRCC